MDKISSTHGCTRMTDFVINNTGSQTGTSGADKLTYNINVAGGVTLTGLTGTAAGYAGTFNGPTTNDGAFTLIERFEFNDNVGGNDNITVGDNADTLNGGAGNDTLNGAGGADVIVTGTGSDSVDGGAGNDTVTGTLDGTDNLFGGADTDLLVIAGGATAMVMGASTIVAGAATINHSLFERFDITGSTQGDEIATGTGDDTIDGGAGDDEIEAGAGADEITTGTGSDTVDGAAGDDVITVTLDGIDSIDGGDDTDTLVVVGGSLALTMTATSIGETAGGTIDFLNIESLRITGSSANDELLGGTGADILNGGDGNDTINGGGGLDTLTGGAGIDFLVIDQSASTTAVSVDLTLTTGRITGFEGAIVTTGSGDDSFRGKRPAANDTTSVGENDVVSLGAGNDRASVMLYGDDTLDGGADTDTLVVFGRGAVAVTTSSFVQIGSTFAATYTSADGSSIDATGFENVEFVGSSVGDSFQSGSGADKLFGEDGDDVLDSGKGIDEIYGGAGNDMWIKDLSGASKIVLIDVNGTNLKGYLTTGKYQNIEGVQVVTGSKNDTVTTHVSADMDDSLTLGGGNDIANVYVIGNDSVFGGGGTDRMNIIATDDVVGMEFNFGTKTASSYAGSVNVGDNSVEWTGVEVLRFTGKSGADDVTAGIGADTLSGNGGNDVLAGGAGSDRLFGGAGADTITGGNGNDFLYGGDGADRFVFSKTGNSGNDKIFGWVDGQDKVRVVDAVFGDFTITARNGDAIVTFDNGTRLVIDNAAGDIGAGDFVFV